VWQQRGSSHTGLWYQCLSVSFSRQRLRDAPVVLCMGDDSHPPEIYILSVKICPAVDGRKASILSLPAQSECLKSQPSTASSPFSGKLRTHLIRSEEYVPGLGNSCAHLSIRWAHTRRLLWSCRHAPPVVFPSQQQGQPRNSESARPKACRARG
jgi:hypothetical protein